MIRAIGPAYATKLVWAFGEKVFDTTEAEPERLREVTGIGPVRAKRILDAWAEQKGRALAVEPHTTGDRVKVSRSSPDKRTNYRGVVANHLVRQVTGFRASTRTPTNARTISSTRRCTRCSCLWATGLTRAGSNGRPDQRTAIPLGQKPTHGLLCQGSAVVSLYMCADSPVDAPVVEIFLEESVAIDLPDEVTPRA
jgi:hypothetical protein